MKITINTTATKEIELPMYFKTSKYSYWMLCGNNAVVKVISYYEIDIKLGLFPKIEAMSADSIKHYIGDKLEPISEAEFKSAYIRVSLEIEKLMN